MLKIGRGRCADRLRFPASDDRTTTMLHPAFRPRTPRRAPRGVALVLAALTLTAASAAHAAPVFSVGSKQVIYTAGQRQSLGLNHWPDGSMGVAPAGNGQLYFYGANSSQSVRTTGTLTAPGTSKQNVSILGGSGFNYRAGGPIYTDPTTGTRLMLYHAEEHVGGAQHFYSTLGLAVARNSGGLVFDDLGTILRTNLSSPQYGSVDMGSGSFTAHNGELYVHYRDYLADGSSSQLAVAKAPLASVIANAMNRQGTQFTKYYNGGWTQPGIGGLASPLEIGNPDNAWSSVTYNDYLNQFVMATTQWSNTDGGNLYLSTSNDGINWGARQTLAVDPGEQFYPTLIGTDADPTRTGKSMYVYYTDSAAGAWDRWNDAQLVRREITFDPSTPAPAPAGWAAVSSFAADYQTGGPAQGWQYLWAPTGKSSPSTYSTLSWSNVAGAYNTTGGATPEWVSGRGQPADYLELGAGFGHPGQPNHNVIAAYTIQADDGAGAYRLTNTSLMKNDSITSAGEDGLSLQVYVNNSLVGGAQTVGMNGASLSFDRDLGQLAIGDTVYVAVGAGRNQNFDGFTGFDFALHRNLNPTSGSSGSGSTGGTSGGGSNTGSSNPPGSLAGVIVRAAVGRGAIYTPVATPAPTPTPPAPTPTPPPAPTPDPTPDPGMAWTSLGSFLGDFQTGAPADGWRYMWSSGGKPGLASAYTSLFWSNAAGAYNTTGGATPVWANGVAHADDYLSLGAGVGHPGQPGYNVIAAYTIQAEDGAGAYRLTNTSVMKSDATVSAGEDGLALLVYVNNAVMGSVLTAGTNGAAVNFDRSLGQLNVGDTIYVMLGPGANQSYDGFKAFDFTIQKLMPIAQAVLAFGAVPEPASAVQMGVVVALLAVRRRRAQKFDSPFPSP